MRDRRREPQPQLRHNLGYPDVRNDDGSWTEWGSPVRTPIEKP